MTRNFGVQFFRVTVNRRINAAVEDFLQRVDERKETPSVTVLRALLTELLTAAAEEIVDAFEQTVSEYEGREERAERERKLFEAALKPRVRLDRVDVQRQKMMIKNKEPPEQQQQKQPPVVQENIEPLILAEGSNIMLIIQDGWQLQGSEETDIRLMLTSVPVKSEEDEEKPQFPQPDQHFQPGPGEKMESSSEPVTIVGDVRQEIRGHQATLNTGSNNPTVAVTTAPTNEGPITRSGVNQGFVKERQVTERTPVHMDGMPFVCAECGRGFKRKKYLTVHMLVHSNERPLKCPVCGRGFRRKYNLRDHMFVHASERPYKCPKCGKGFNSKSYMKDHILSHSGESPYRCPECGKGFNHKSNLKIHMPVHMVERPFRCPKCDKGFRRKKDIKVHMLVHMSADERERSFQCSECDKAFRRKGELKAHMLVHSSERPFLCTECDKGFRRKGELKAHMSVHKDKRP